MNLATAVETWFNKCLSFIVMNWSSQINYNFNHLEKISPFRFYFLFVCLDHIFFYVQQNPHICVHYYYKPVVPFHEGLFRNVSLIMEFMSQRNSSIISWRILFFYHMSIIFFPQYWEFAMFFLKRLCFFSFLADKKLHASGKFLLYLLHWC